MRPTRTPSYVQYIDLSSPYGLLRGSKSRHTIGGILLRMS
jgi:hypothetical protein